MKCLDARIFLHKAISAKMVYYFPILLSWIFLSYSPNILARTARVCYGPALPPTDCFTIDTSTINGIPFEKYKVNNTNTLLVDVNSRRQELLNKLPDKMGIYCSTESLIIPKENYEPIISVTCQDQNSECLEFDALNEFRNFIIATGADYLAFNSDFVADKIISTLLNWAEANALSVFPGLDVGANSQMDFRQKYTLQWILVPVVQTWSMVRNDPRLTAQDRLKIEAWLDRVVGYATEKFGGPQGFEDPFNVGYLVRGLKMAWGITKGNNLDLAEGIEKILMGLHQMREDGSFPREVARGACAVRYQNTMLLNLLFMAELAAMQGYDIYSLSVDQKTLHNAVNFLLDAIDNPETILKYAYQDAENCSNAPQLPSMDLSQTIDATNGFTYSAWLEAYIARFPNHPNSSRLKTLLVRGLENTRPIYHPHSGGNTTCFYANSDLGRTANLESPQNGSFESGIGLIRGWICNANFVEIQINDQPRQQVAYGTTREDTVEVCGDDNNGFGYTFNWNTLGTGTHRLRVYSDGVQFADVNFRVTVLDEEYLRGVSGEYALPNFPKVGQNITVRWSEPHQNFVISGADQKNSSTILSSTTPLSSILASLESPQQSSFESGIGLIRGWVCEANTVDIQIDDQPLVRIAYGTTRKDTIAVCGDDNNGFGYTFNWNTLGTGTHRLKAFADGIQFADITFSVTTLGEIYLREAAGEYNLSDFPQAARNITLRWSEPHQNFVISDFR